MTILGIQMAKNALRSFRKRKNLTQKEAAKFFGLPLRTYQNYEQDHRPLKGIIKKYLALIEKLDQIL